MSIIIDIHKDSTQNIENVLPPQDSEMEHQMKSRVKIFLSKHRRSRLIQKLDQSFIGFHRAYENMNYDFSSNGEENVLKRLKATISCKTIFDVGANSGEWSCLTSTIFPDAHIHAFEIMPETFQSLLNATSQIENFSPHNVGLSDVEGTIPVYYSPDKSSLATCVPEFSEKFHRYKPKKLVTNITKGDIFCRNKSIDTIDFLKIDVEGHEHNVLKGFEGMLKAGRVKIIQFEYGYVNICTHFLLKDYYEYLEGFDMKIGKIYPRYVDFREYSYSDENFFGPNYLAVHSSCGEVIDSLSA